MLHTKHISCEPQCFRVGFSKLFSDYKSLKAYDSWGVAHLEPRGMDGRTDVVNYWALLHILYIRCGFMVIDKKIFQSFPQYKSSYKVGSLYF